MQISVEPLTQFLESVNSYHLPLHVGYDHLDKIKHCQIPTPFITCVSTKKNID